MMRKILWSLFFLPTQYLFAQQQITANPTSEKLAPLTVEKIMRDPQWIGSSPSDVFWSPDGQTIYFQWNPEKNDTDSLYYITLNNHNPQKATFAQRTLAVAERNGSWNSDQTKLVFLKDKGLYLLNLKAGNISRLIQTTKDLSTPTFGLHDTCILYQEGDNLFSINIHSGALTQITDFKKGKKEEAKTLTAQESFLKNDALENSLILRQEKQKETLQKKAKQSQTDLPKTIYIGHQEITFLTLSPDGNYVFYELESDPDVKNTIVPNYVTQSGYTEDQKGRPVVGTEQPTFKSYLYDRKKDTVYALQTNQIPGIRDIPEFIKKYYPKEATTMLQDTTDRATFLSYPFWNTEGNRAFVVVQSLDHKDRWIMEMNEQTGNLKLLDRQHDDAWIGGPGIGYPYEIGNVGWINEKTIWYQSEKTGYSHLYTMNVVTGEKTALTQGKYEVQTAQLSPDKKTFYITTNKVEPSQNQFYLLDIKSKKQTRITQMSGGNQVVVSPNGNNVAVLYSTLIHPWELYLQDNKAGSKAIQITHKAESPAYQSYDWRDPQIITFKDRDGFNVHASIYKPAAQAPTKPGVIFVHGAGYLQDVIRSWSYYFREHMFMNMLADQGYTVMDIDYRGSAGYGRDWRTAIYRHMGGNDLEDIVDGAKYMTDSLNVSHNKIGIWGGSYGGFMTLMAMFKAKTFACGAALRSVTDWAHYNHDYTSDILNLPQNDSIAYVQSSPIYFADSLEGHLLMCHGMVDPNVHFQDIVRVTQKLIESGKKNWELAVYPVEGHDFETPSSWTDEYWRIYQLFEKNLK